MPVPVQEVLLRLPMPVILQYGLYLQFDYYYHLHIHECTVLRMHQKLLLYRKNFLHILHLYLHLTHVHLLYRSCIQFSVHLYQNLLHFWQEQLLLHHRFCDQPSICKDLLYLHHIPVQGLPEYKLNL